MRAIPGARANIAAIADAIVTVKKNVDANVATTVNVIASDARVSDNVAVNVNVNKTTSYIRKRVPTYWVI